MGISGIGLKHAKFDMFSYFDIVAKACNSDRPPSKAITLLNHVLCLTVRFGRRSYGVLQCFFSFDHRVIRETAMHTEAIGDLEMTSKSIGFTKRLQNSAL